MLHNFKKSIYNNLRNISGWRTKRKIVVIESDDWGSIRMPSKEVFNKLLKAGIRVDQCPYNSYDSLASEDDLSALFETLLTFKDKNGNCPVITANTIVANPDFDKIRDSGFKEYHYELFTETLQKYPNHSNSFQLWQDGIKEGVFYPQFHGREHVNINRWMKGLQDNLAETHFAFNCGLFGISTNITSEKRKSYMATFDFDIKTELDYQRKIISEGLDHFDKIFGYRSKSFIATNYVWNSNLEPELAKGKIKYLQGAFYQFQPEGNNKPYKKIRHRTGEKNNLGLIYLTRNCSFEPSLFGNTGIINNCLEDMATAFRWGKPAVINSHRVNYVGTIVPENRVNNLKLLSELIKSALLKWPQIEFVSSDHLGDIISGENR